MESSDSGTVRPLRPGDDAEERLLWRRFRDAASPEAFYESWLTIQCRTIANVEAGLLLIRSQRTGVFSPAANWPADQRPGAHVRAAADRVLKEGRALALALDSQADPSGVGLSHTIIARPVEVAGETEAVVVLDVAPRRERELESALRELTWGCAWLELQALRDSSSGSGGRLASLLALVSTPLEHERFQAAATAFVTELATRTRCERVSLGAVQRQRVRLLALSHSALFDQRASLTRLLEAAMEETIDHGAAVIWPPTSDAAPRLMRAHAELARESEGGVVCSVPIARGSRLCGVVTLERASGETFAESELDLVDAAVEIAGPILEIHRRDDRPLLAKALEVGRANLENLTGPRHAALKLAAALLVLLVVFLALAKGDFRVAADTTLEARVLRASVAPFDGYILEAPVRAGDVVREGDLLALLDDRDLRLERDGHAGELEQLAKQYRQALGERDASNVRILSARMDQVRAQHNLVSDQLSRTRLVAAFDGIVVSGDLSQKLDAPVERGDVLFELAPLEDYRAVLEVDERDVDELRVGQKGQVVFAAFPEQPIDLEIESITPVSSASEGRNTFRVEARLAETLDRLRPGMEGVAKVEVDRRRLLWIWTHDLVDWLRLKSWRWLP